MYVSTKASLNRTRKNQKHKERGKHAVMNSFYSPFPEYSAKPLIPQIFPSVTKVRAQPNCRLSLRLLRPPHGLLFPRQLLPPKAQDDPVTTLLNCLQGWRVHVSALISGHPFTLIFIRITPMPTP